MARPARREPIEWSVATHRRPGEATNGDSAVVRLRGDGVLIAAIDGLGHGAEATRAAEAAAAVLRACPGHDLVALLRACHAALRGTRGAAITLAFVATDDGGVRWLGVGNVEGRILSGEPGTRGSRESLVLAPGIPGHELPRLRATAHVLARGDLLVLATDGIDATFADSLDISGTTQAISERILAEHRRGRDDALVLTVRYLGGGS